MKLPILTATVLLLLGTTASIYARQEKGQDDHSQEAKPAKQEAKPAQERPQAKPEERQQTQNVKPGPQAKPTQQAKTAPKRNRRQACGTAADAERRAGPTGTHATGCKSQAATGKYYQSHRAR